MSVLSDGIGDRDIPGATAKQLVDVSILQFYFLLLYFFPLFFLLLEENVVVDEEAWV